MKNIDRIKTLDVNQLATVLTFIKGSTYIGVDKFVYFGGFSAPTKDSPFETDRKNYMAILESEDDSIIDAILNTVRCE